MYKNKLAVAVSVVLFLSGFASAQRSDNSAVYRFYNAQADEQLLTVKCSEMAVVGQSGFSSQGIAFYLPTRPTRNTIALHRLNIGSGGHLYTTDRDEINRVSQIPGYGYEDIVGYISTSQQRNTVPLYRLYNGRTHFYTTSERERSNYLRQPGGRFELITGYVWTSGDEPCGSGTGGGGGGYPGPSRNAVIYAQTDFNGPALAIERDWPGSRDWDGNPYRIRSIRVPRGRPVMVYEKTNFRGRSYLVSSDWTPQPGDWWFGKIRSIKVDVPRQPR